MWDTLERYGEIVEKATRVTIKEIAERTGVSTGAVHCAIYGKKGVSEKTRQIILDEVERSGYRMNESASLLKRGEQQIMVVLPQMAAEDAYYFRSIWHGIRQAAAQHSLFQFRYIETPYSMQDMAKELSCVYDEEVENIHGLITFSDDQEASNWTARFVRRGVQTIVISSYKDESGGVYSVKVDHVKAGKLAGEFFQYALRNQSGKLLVLTGDAEIYSHQKYAEAFLSYMKKHCPLLEPVCIPGLGRDAIDAPLQQALATGQYLGAFICNARNTIHFCQVMEQFPQNHSMINVGTDVFCELKPYFDNGTLSASIYQSNKEQGMRAVEMMQSLLVGTGPKEHLVEMPIGLVMKYNYEFYIS